MKKPKSYDKAEDEAIHLMEYADGNRVSFISLLSLVLLFAKNVSQFSLALLSCFLHVEENDCTMGLLDGVQWKIKTGRGTCEDIFDKSCIGHSRPLS